MASSNLGKKGVISVYTLWSQCVHEGNQERNSRGQELKQRSRRNVPNWLAHSLFSCLGPYSCSFCEMTWVRMAKPHSNPGEAVSYILPWLHSAGHTCFLLIRCFGLMAEPGGLDHCYLLFGSLSSVPALCTHTLYGDHLCWLRVISKGSYLHKVTE